jgi:hypothetical protein
MKSNAEIGTTKAQFGVRTTIISQLFGVNGSTIPRDMQNYFEYSQISYLQFLTCDLIVLNTVFKLESVLTLILQLSGSIFDAKQY